MKVNRRHFVTGLLSVPVAGIAMAKAPEFTENVNSMRTKTVSLEELKKIYPAPGKTLYVHGSLREAACWARLEGQVHINAGAALCGQGFNRIVLMTDWDRGFYSQQLRDDYYNCTLRCRLFPGGTIMHYAEQRA